MDPTITIEPAVAITIVICLTVAYVVKKMVEARTRKPSTREVVGPDTEDTDG